MKISCNRTMLSEAVMNVSRAVSSKSSLPALEGILLKTNENSLFLSGYDLETGIETVIDATVFEAGEIILSAKILSDIVRKMSSERVEISCDEKLLTVISGGAAEFTILGIPSNEYPEMPTYNEIATFKISQNKLKSMINQTIYAVSQVDTKPVHTGSLFELVNDTLTVISVDGFRLAIRKEKIDFDDEISFIVPGKALTEIAKLLSDDDDNEIEISVGKKQITFKLTEYKVLSRLIEGEFLNYRKTIPAESSIKVRVKTKDFIESIERVSLLITEKLKSPVRCSFKDNEISLSCATTIGKACDSVQCKTDGEPLEIGFNNKYLIEALRYCECDEVLIEMNTPVSPMKMSALDGDNILYLILPVRLKEEI